MLRNGAYRFWKASGCVSLDSSPIIEATLRSIPLMDKCFAPSLMRRPFSTGSEDEEERTITNPKVLELADQITQLNLLEVSDLTEILKKRLNIQTPVGSMAFAMPQAGAPMAGAAGAAPAAAAPQEEKTEFTIKLEGFDAASKIKVIKEVRGITDLGLKEAKDLVEGAPAVLKKGIKKEEAEEIKAKLEAAGAKIVLE